MLHFHFSILELLDRGLCTAPHTYLIFLYALIVYPVFYMCAVCNIYFLVGYLCLFFFFLCLTIAPHSALYGVFNTMSCTNTSWPVVAFSVVWYMLHTKKTIAANIPDQGSSLSRSLFWESTLQTGFDMTWWMLYNIELACGFDLVLHLYLIPY